jgi:hypothetical protein
MKVHRVAQAVTLCRCGINHGSGYDNKLRRGQGRSKRSNPQEGARYKHLDLTAFTDFSRGTTECPKWK